ncbi:hypothetical protein B0T17DRAFT_466463, partial [Bombardia bombarda]
RQQQVTLDIFKATFADVLNSDSFSANLQAIKQALFERDFAKAFPGTDDDKKRLLAVYAARYSPTRALCYATLLASLHRQQHLQGVISTVIDDDGEEEVAQEETSKQLNLLCIGGGAAELVAFGSFLSQLRGGSSPLLSPDFSSDDNNDNTSPDSLSGSITLLDSAAWGPVISDLQHTLITPPPISKFASAAAKEAHRPIIPPPNFSATFMQQDVLSLDRDGLSNIITTTNKANPHAPLLVTLLFTLNELFTSGGIGKTTAFLLHLTAVIPLGSLLLVVDSPGSYSTTKVGSKKEKDDAAGGDAKRYPMQWLLDRIMLATAREPVKGRRWTKLEDNDSAWFRLAVGNTLTYPIPLEDMRYQLHLYRADDAS